MGAMGRGDEEDAEEPVAGRDAAPPPWTAEREVDAATARALLADAFPRLRLERVEPFGVGWDNVAWLVDGAWVFRFPRRAIAVDLLRTETSVLPLVAASVPLPVPEPTLVAEGDARFPWPFAGYRLRVAAVIRDYGLEDRAEAPADSAALL